MRVRACVCCVCEYQHILGIIRIEDDPNSFDLQKDSLCRRDSDVSPFVTQV